MKLSIAVALSHDAKLLILDEATSGLDPVVRDEILDIFLDYIQNEDCSILIASHITSDLEKVADYITFVNNGKIIFSENKDELIYNSGVVKCSEKDIDKISKEDIVGIRKNTFGCEVMVSDRAKYENIGFVIDKTIEGVAKVLVKSLKDGFMSSTRTKAGAVLAKPALKQLLTKFDTKAAGGALMMGFVKPVIKAHGSSDAIAFENAINLAFEMVSSDVVEKMKEGLN